MSALNVPKCGACVVVGYSLSALYVPKYGACVVVSNSLIARSCKSDHDSVLLRNVSILNLDSGLLYTLNTLDN